MRTKYYGNSEKSGVYKITNVNNGKIYIGSAKKFSTRYSQHINSLRNNKHQNKHLQSSFNKHGENAFVFEVIEVVEGDKKTRTQKEQDYINEQIYNWSYCFNFKKETIQKERSCFSKTPEETKRKREETTFKRYGKPYWSQTDEARQLLKRVGNRKPSKEEIEKIASKKRRKLSKEHYDKLIVHLTSDDKKQKMSKMSKEWWKDPEYREKVLSKKRGKKLSYETKQKMSEAKQRETFVLFISPEGVEHPVYSISQFCFVMNLDKSHMCRLANGEYNQICGWTTPYSKPFSKIREEKGKKISYKRKNKPNNLTSLKPVYQMDMNDHILNEFVCIAEAQRQTGIPNPNITKCCKGKLNKAGGYKWKYKVS